METVEIAACLLEILDPFLWLFFCQPLSSTVIWCRKKEEGVTSEIIMWQSNVPFPCFWVGFATWLRILVTTGAPKVIFGTKCPSMISTWSLFSSLGVSVSYSEWMATKTRGQGTQGILEYPIIPQRTSTYQSAPWEIVSEHALPSSAKSAERIEGAIMAGGAIVRDGRGWVFEGVERV